MTATSGFDAFKLNKQLLTAIAELGFQAPTAIQSKAIPCILGGQDVLGVAQTGTGKTAAYLIPLLMKIKYAQGKDPRALILVPTRELVVQVTSQVAQLAKYTDLRTVSLYGGVGPKTQIEAIANGVDILVATPGRLMDIYLSGNLSLKKIEVFVMDEAERLLDMGFKPQIHRILEVVSRKRQNLLFTATWSNKVKRIAEDFLEAPTEINIDPEVRTAKTVSQLVYFVPNIKTKISLLDKVFLDSPEKAIVFCKTKEAATNVYKYLCRIEGEEMVRIIHGNKGQNARLNAIQAFRDSGVNYLVTTDVAARGIDIPNVGLVVNFDVPLVYEDYVHRIGRTGRIFNTGASITFCAPQDEYHLRKIEKLIGEKVPVAELPDDIRIAETPFEERQAQLREIDMQRKKDDPSFRGAFHDKKYKKK
jgi:ATP-dependent RNA helicase RhlE